MRARADYPGRGGGLWLRMIFPSGLWTWLMLAEFEVRVALHPTGRDPRLAITGMEISPDGFEMTG